MKTAPFNGWADAFSACEGVMTRDLAGSDGEILHVPAKRRSSSRRSTEQMRSDFWANRYRIFAEAVRDPKLVRRALQTVTRSAVSARFKGGAAIGFQDALIDVYLRDFHERFRGGRQEGAVGPIRKAIGRELARDRDLSTAALWGLLKDAPPRGWEFHENRAGKYAEGPKPGQNTDYRSFENACSKERKRLKITG